MIDIPFITCLTITLFAGIYDLKTSDVFEEVPALLISFGLFYWFMFSLIQNNFIYFINSVLVGIFFLSFGLFLYKARFWGDGDAWILGGIGFLVPHLRDTFIIYPLSFIFNLLIVGGVYSAIYILIYGILNKEIRKKFVLKFKKHHAIYLGFLLTCICISIYLPFMFLIGFLPLIYLYAKIIEKGMRKRISTEELKVGDVLAGEEISGLKEEDIMKIRKEKEFIEIQEGVRFTMVFPLTLIFIYFFGGLFGLFII